MKKRWLLVLVAAIMLLVFPAVSLAGGGAINEVLLEGEATPAVTPEPIPTQAPTEVPTAEPVPTITLAPHPTAEPDSIEIDRDILILNINEKYTLGSFTQPVWEPYKVIWRSSDASIVTVTQYGEVTATGVGRATITARIEGSNLSDTCEVEVRVRHVAFVDCVEMYQYDIINVGDTVVLHAIVNPPDSSYPEVTWSSNDTSILKVTRTGPQSAVVTGVSAGHTTITMTADGVSSRMMITVNNSGVSSIVTPRPSSANITAAHTPAPTRGTEESVYDGPQPTRMPIELEATDWEAAEQAIAGMEPGSLGSIGMPDDTLVPVSLLQTLRQTQCALEIDMGGYTCTIDGASLFEIPDDFGTVDIGMTMEKDAKLSAACGGSAYELRFNYHGELPGVFTFRVKAEGSRPGDTIYVYYFNEDAGELESLVAATVDGEGCVSFGVTHCSSYYITNALIPGAENNFEVAAETAEKPEAGRSSDNFVAFWVCAYVLGSGVVLAAFVLIFRRRGRRRDAGQQAYVKEQHTYMKR